MSLWADWVQFLETQTIKVEGLVSEENSSNDVLLAGGTFTGSAIEILDCGIIFINVYSDVGSAVNGLQIEQSSDGNNWYHCDEYTVPAGNGKNYAINPHAKYLRVLYTNGGIDQAVFALQTICKGNSVPSSHRIQDSINDEDDARLVKSVLTGKANGEFKNVRTTIDGYLAISDNSSGLSIAQGNVTGLSFIHKFGNAPDFDQSDGQVTIWDGAEDGAAWELMNYIYSSTADIDSISSSNAGDNHNINIQGLDADYNLIVQSVTLNGQTRVPLATNLIRVFRAFNESSTDFVGHIIVYVNTGLAGGVPIDNTKIRLVIDPIHQQTRMALFTIPSGFTGYMRDWYASTSGANKNTNYPITLIAREFGGVFRTKHTSALSDTGTSSYQHNYNEPEIFTEKADIEMRVEVIGVGTTGANISGGFDLVLVENI